jgi:hypothetical protein
MKYLTMLAAAAVLLLSGCATTIRSDVTVFHEWPADLTNKSYVFTTPPRRQDTLELHAYQNLLRNRLAALGFNEAPSTDEAKLRVALRFFTVDQPVVVTEAYDPFFAGPGYWGPYGWGGRYGYPGRFGYGRFGYGGGYYGPFGDPFLYNRLEVEQSVRHVYQRTLNVTIDSVDGKRLYNVTAVNTSTKPSTASVMPAMVISAFDGFPGQSGVPHRVEVQQDK